MKVLPIFKFETENAKGKRFEIFTIDKMIEQFSEVVGAKVESDIYLKWKEFEDCKKPFFLGLIKIKNEKEMVEFKRLINGFGIYDLDIVFIEFDDIDSKIYRVGVVNFHSNFTSVEDKYFVAPEEFIAKYEERFFYLPVEDMLTMVRSEEFLNDVYEKSTRLYKIGKLNGKEESLDLSFDT